MQWMKTVTCVVLLVVSLAGCAGRIPLISSYYSSKDGTVTVRKGDTLYSLSKKHQVPLRALMDENNIKPPYTIAVGQRLRLPGTRTHTVQKGETLYSISRRYGMNVSTLSKQNNLAAPYTLAVGQKLRIAGGSAQTSVAPQSTAAQPVKKTVAPKKAVAKKAVVAKDSIKVPASQAKKRFAWPVQGKIVSSYGSKGHGQYNDGINIAGKKGTPIKAADAGTVAYAGSELKGYGKLVLIRHANGWITAYAHNDKLLVKKGQSVKKGTQIATMGSTGNVKTPQLHFEIRYKTKVVNPKKYLQ